MSGYVKAKGIEAKAIMIVNRLKLISTKNAIKHKKVEYSNASFTDISPEAKGLFFVLKTFLSNFLSSISFIMHPADLISTDPKKNNNK